MKRERKEERYTDMKKFFITLISGLLLATGVMADARKNGKADTFYVVQLDCEKWTKQECYASWSGSGYTSLHGARRFATRIEAVRYLDKLTNRIRSKNPRVMEICPAEKQTN